ncbi:MAG: SPOR domain-containing protein [bacterium]
MADLEFEDFEGGYGISMSDARLERARKIVSLAGAVCSVALVLGLGFWGYRLAVRDVAGVPVMRALAGPMRVAPADPGGDQASNQGLSVNVIAATGSSGPVADEVTLAPRPVSLRSDDVSGLSILSSSQPIHAAGVTLVSSISVAGQAQSGTPVSLALNDPPPVDDGAGTLVDDATGTSVEVDNAVPEPVSVTEGTTLVTVSLRPHSRPDSLTGSKTPMNVRTVSAPPPATEIDPATLQIGTRLAQLGAFDTPELAKARFAELQSQFGDLMAGKAMVVQSAQSGGRTFYRLRAHGFDGDDDARRFCAVLQAEDADCIPVAQR